MISVVGRATLPLLYEVVAASGSFVSPTRNPGGLQDVIVILALGLFATLPGAGLGNLLGGVIRKLLSGAIALRRRRGS